MGPGGAELYIFKCGEPRIVEIFSCSNQSCKSERRVVFFWYGRDQMGPGGAEIYGIFLTMRGVLLLICGIGCGY